MHAKTPDLNPTRSSAEPKTLKPARVRVRIRIWVTVGMVRVTVRGWRVAELFSARTVNPRDAANFAESDDDHVESAAVPVEQRHHVDARLHTQRCAS